MQKRSLSSYSTSSPPLAPAYTYTDETSVFVAASCLDRIAWTMCHHRSDKRLLMDKSNQNNGVQRRHSKYEDTSQRYDNGTHARVCCRSLPCDNKALRGDALSIYTTARNSLSSPSSPSLSSIPTTKLCQSSPDRVVRFGSVHIREYGVTVGAYAASNDSCPLQLTWEHAPSDLCLSIEDHQEEVYMQRQKLQATSLFSPSCVSCGSLPDDVSTLQRLSITQRRKRIASVQGTSLQAVTKLEYDTAMLMIEDTVQVIQTLQQFKRADRCSPCPFST